LKKIKDETWMYIQKPEAEEIMIEKESHCLDDRNTYNKMTSGINPYGDGISAKKIIKAIGV